MTPEQFADLVGKNMREAEEEQARRRAALDRIRDAVIESLLVLPEPWGNQISPDKSRIRVLWKGETVALLADWFWTEAGASLVVTEGNSQSGGLHFIDEGNTSEFFEYLAGHIVKYAMRD